MKLYKVLRQFCTCFSDLISKLDPLSSIRRQHNTRSKTLPNAGHQKSDSAQILRANSIRTNRRNKFVDCIMAEDVNIG